MRDFAKRVDIYKQVPYTRIYRDKDGKIKEEQKVLGTEGVLASATDNFFYTPDETLLLTAAQGLVREVNTEGTMDIDSLSTDVPNIVFTPDNPLKVPDVQTFYLEATKKGFREDLVNDLVNKLVNVYQTEFETPLFEDVATEEGEQE